jgi:hypothetical protein
VARMQQCQFELLQGLECVLVCSTGAVQRGPCLFCALLTKRLAMLLPMTAQA